MMMMLLLLPWWHSPYDNYGGPRRTTTRRVDRLQPQNTPRCQHIRPQDSLAYANVHKNDLRDI